MLEVAPTNQAIKPELHVFLPPSTNNDFYEITLAGFMPLAPEPLWKCDITASSEFDNDENLKTTIEMAAELFCQAKIVAHDHMFDGTTGCMTVNLATHTNQ